MTGRTVERWNAVPVPERVAERAYERVERRSDGCWISTYSVASHGYSQIGWQGNGERHTAPLTSKNVIEAITGGPTHE